MSLATYAEAVATLPDLTTDQLADLQATLDAATAVIEGECGRILASRETCEERAPGHTRIIRLRNYPITSVARVATNATNVMTVSYSGSASRATASMTATGMPPYVAPSGLTLSSVTSGVTTTTNLAFATYPTLTALSVAVAAVSGWSATIATGYETFATTDLQADISIRSAKSASLPIYAYTTDLQGWAIDPESGELSLGSDFSAKYRHPDRTWGVGHKSGFAWVRYTAGFSTVPADLKRACITVAARMFADAASSGGTIKSEKVGSDGWEAFDPARKGGGLLAGLSTTLNRYRRVSIA